MCWWATWGGGRGLRTEFKVSEDKWLRSEWKIRVEKSTGKWRSWRWRCTTGWGWSERVGRVWRLDKKWQRQPVIDVRWAFSKPKPHLCPTSPSTQAAHTPDKLLFFFNFFQNIFRCLAKVPLLFEQTSSVWCCISLGWMKRKQNDNMAKGSYPDIIFVKNVTRPDFWEQKCDN